MKSEITTTLAVKDNHVEPLVLKKWLEVIPDNAKLSFVIQPGYDDRMSYSPDKVTGIKATWIQEF